MIKLTDLFEIMVTPRRVLIFKIPVTITEGGYSRVTGAYDEDIEAKIEYSNGVSTSPQVLLSDLNLYAKHPALKFSEVVAEIEEDTDKFDDVRCIRCAPELNDDPYKDLPNGFILNATVHNRTGVCYVSFKGVDNIKLNDIEGLVTIFPFSQRPLNTVQDAANYLLFKSN